MAKDVKVAILGDASSFKRAVSEAASSASSAEGHFAKVGDGIKKIGQAMAVGVAAAGVAGAAFAKSAISAASDLNESLGKSQVVFGDSAKDIEAWASTAATAFGQSKQQALEAVGTYGNLFQAFGIGKDASAKMSKSLVELAADLASFNNTSVEEALQSLQSGISGETEPLKKYGIAVNDARLKAEAFRLGLVKAEVDLNKWGRAEETLEKANRKVAEALKKNGKNSTQYADAVRDAEQAEVALANVLEGKLPNSLNEAQKAQAAYSLIMKDSALAQGDFSRTSGGLANQQRILSAQFEDLKAKAGEKLLPVFLTIVSAINNQVMPALRNVGEIFRGVFSGDGFETNGAKVESVIKGIAITFKALADAVKVVIAWIQDTGWPALQQAFDVLRGWLSDLKDGWDSRWQDIRKAVENVLTAIKTAIGVVLAVIMTLWRQWGDDLKNIVQGFMNAIKGIIDVVLGLLSGDWGRAWDGLKSIVSGAVDAIKALLGGLASTIGELGSYMWEGLRTGFRAVINWIIDRWNGLEFRVPGVEAFGQKIGGFTIGVPDIPRLAQGGIAMAPTLAMIGDNGGRGEAVIPLDKLEQMMGKVGGEFHVYIDGREIQASVRRRERMAA